MRYHLAVIFLAFVLTACSKAPTKTSEMPTAGQPPADAAQQQTSSIEPIVQFLLASAASDFHDHGPKGQLRFQNVRVGHTSDADTRYVMCGQFQRVEEGDKAEWMGFATIKTSGYEQYIGKGSTSYCQNVTWDTQGDFSSELHNKLDSLR